MDVFQATDHVIQAVFTFSAFVVFTGHGHRIEFHREQVAGIFECETYFGKATGTPAFRAVEDQALKVLTTQVADLMFTNHPADTVYDIALAASVRTYYTGYTFVKIKYGLVCKTLESLYF